MRQEPNFPTYVGGGDLWEEPEPNPPGPMTYTIEFFALVAWLGGIWAIVETVSGIIS